MLDGAQVRKTNIVLGPCLVGDLEHPLPTMETRHPCRLLALHAFYLLTCKRLVTRGSLGAPTDFRQFIAVNIVELSQYLDVIVFSTKGSRSPASLLGGGQPISYRVKSSLTN